MLSLSVKDMKSSDDARLTHGHMVWKDCGVLALCKTPQTVYIIVDKQMPKYILTQQRKGVCHNFVSNKSCCVYSIHSKSGENRL